MTDGISGIISGDRKFFQYTGIEASLADASARTASDPVLDQETEEMANRLGYVQTPRADEQHGAFGGSI